MRYERYMKFEQIKRAIDKRLDTMRSVELESPEATAAFRDLAEKLIPPYYEWTAETYSVDEISVLDQIKTACLFFAFVYEEMAITLKNVTDEDHEDAFELLLAMTCLYAEKSIRIQETKVEYLEKTADGVAVTDKRLANMSTTGRAN